jgi:hypothetical protein
MVEGMVTTIQLMRKAKIVSAQRRRIDSPLEEGRSAKSQPRTRRLQRDRPVRFEAAVPGLYLG